MYKIATATLESVTPYSPSRVHDVPALKGEGKDAYELRTWREKAHTTESGEIIIPPMAFKMALDNACKYLGQKIPGKKNATWTKHFAAGVLCADPVRLGVHKDQAAMGRYYCNSDGVRGSGKRVWRQFPEINKWKGDAIFYITDPIITREIFEETLKCAGQFIGVGRFRPQSGGFFGRFNVTALNWQDVRD